MSLRDTPRVRGKVLAVWSVMVCSLRSKLCCNCAWASEGGHRLPCVARQLASAERFKVRDHALQELPKKRLLRIGQTRHRLAVGLYEGRPCFRQACARPPCQRDERAALVVGIGLALSDAIAHHSHQGLGHRRLLDASGLSKFGLGQRSSTGESAKHGKMTHGEPEGPQSRVEVPQECPRCAVDPEGRCGLRVPNFLPLFALHRYLSNNTSVPMSQGHVWTRKCARACHDLLSRPRPAAAYLPVLHSCGSEPPS